MKRIVELDGLRGIAAVVVVLFHLQTRGFELGWSAVDLFFVLSGFLITSIILKYQGQPGFFPRFYIRRGLRLWPIYYLTVFAMLGANRLLPRPFTTEGSWYFLTYTQFVPQYWGAGRPAFLNQMFEHTWSLALEEQFYLIWPPLLYLVGRRFVAPACLAIAAGAVMGRASGFDRFLLIAHCDGFAAGGLLAALLRDPDRVAARRARLTAALAGLGLACLALMAIAPRLPRSSPLLVWADLLRRPCEGRIALSLFCACLVGLTVLNTGSRLLAPLRHRFVAYLGTISYGIYLYHLVLMRIGSSHAIHARIGDRWLAPGVILGTLLISALSWELIERPILALKDRVRYRDPDVPARPHKAGGRPTLSTTGPSGSRDGRDVAGRGGGSPRRDGR